MRLELRRSFVMVDQIAVPPGSGDAGPPLRRVAVTGVVVNPYSAQGFVQDLSASIAASEAVGRELSAMAVAAMGQHAIESYGKGAVVGLAGEQEHANAMLTTIFAEPLRAAVGGGLAWLPSFTKRGTPGTMIDVPLAHKDALYVRTHYDGMTLMLPDAPQADEVALIIVIANRGRIDARVGGLKASEISKRDGLR
ncbi:amino acid synthesis family protein [Sediminicoccus sp. BL-A-41-H5]|uniref:amino acid synthesis family protein n=1 Tax=Sediminicoccus sp. BL-A-41-H5 TaxID=3421106 RepID=UPI003D67C2E0